MAVQGMNIEILPPGEIKDLGQHITLKNAIEVEFEHHIKYAWATFTSHRQELTSPKYPLRDRLKLFDATVTPSLLHASGTWTMTEEMKEKLQTTPRRMMRMIVQTERKHVKVTQLRTTPTTPTASWRTTRLSTTTTPSTKSQTTIQKTSLNRGSTT